MVGPSAGSKGDDHAEHAHRLSAALGRIDAEQHGLQQGHEHAGEEHAHRRKETAGVW